GHLLYLLKGLIAQQYNGKDTQGNSPSPPTSKS
ncbi:MAG: hypothetical protein RLZZ574_1686, partial [Cyanobacteriota bacterium]